MSQMERAKEDLEDLLARIDEFQSLITGVSRLFRSSTDRTTIQPSDCLCVKAFVSSLPSTSPARSSFPNTLTVHLARLASGQAFAQPRGYTLLPPPST